MISGRLQVPDAAAPQRLLAIALLSADSLA